MACVMGIALIRCTAADGRAGRIGHLCLRRCVRGQAGFTLLEMLVVLVIAGILVSMATLTITRNPRTDLHEQAQRLALLFESAGDEAQVRSRPIAWQPVAGGYRFEVRAADGWRALRDDLLAPRRWDMEVTGVVIRYPGSDDAASRIVFGVESIDTPVQVTLYSAVGQVSIVGNGNGRFEVLVALAIIAIALAASLRAVGVLAVNSSELDKRMYAGWSADNELARLHLMKAWPNIGSRTFDCSQGNLALSCTERVSATPNPVFRRVELSLMKPAARSDPQRGFTLIELLVAVTILAVLAVLSWRGLDSIARSREAISRSMEDERVLAQLFDQMRSDVRQAATDDQAGTAAVAIGSGELRIVRLLFAQDAAPRLQVVHYRLDNGRIVRLASPPIATQGQLRSALRGSQDGWSEVSLIGGVGAMHLRLF
ncbi:hypothetical protein DFQ30_001426, partial [Apophysomyces sp. BC1015]